MNEIFPYTAGRVYLIGAGPGDPGLLTIKAREVLRFCDIVLYDGLVSDAILMLVNSNAELINVSKRAGDSSLSQSDINRMLVDYAKRGQTVARLKGGDPFVFGRGAEEAQALSEAHIDWEVIPGVSAGLAVPAYAGIPLTCRGYASSVAFVTGREGAGKETTQVNWQQLANAVDTLVVFMGLERLPAIMHELILAGRPTDTPVAVIESGTTNSQRTVTGTIDTITELAASLTSPSLIVIGQVVAFRESLNWYEPYLNLPVSFKELDQVPGRFLAGEETDRLTSVAD